MCAAIPNQEILASIPSEPSEEGVDLKFEEYVVQGFLPIQFNWEAELVEDEYRIVEKLYVPFRWYLIFSMSFLFVLSSIIFLRTIGGFSPILFLSGLMISFLAFTLSVLYLLNIETPTTGLFHGSRYMIYTFPIASLLVLLIPIKLIAAFAPISLAVLSLPLSAALLMVFVVLHEQFVTSSRKIQRKIVISGRELPLVVSNYLVSIFFSSIIVGSFLYSYRYGGMVLFEAFPVILPALLSFAVLAVYVIFYNNSMKIWESESLKFRNQGQTGKSSPILAVIIIMSSLLFAAVSYQYFQILFEVVVLDHSLGFLFFTLIIGLPIWYFVFGAVFQAYQFSSLFSDVSLSSEKEDFDHVLSVDVDVYLYDSDEWFAGALGFPQGIVVSKGLVDDLSRGELGFVLAHEEAHLKSGDAWLTVVLAIFSVLTFSGKNVVFSTFDFRGREFEADRRAVSRLDNVSDAISVLDKFENNVAAGRFPGFTSISPTMISFEPSNTGSLRGMLFEFYYGGFAVSDAHASFNERKERIKVAVDQEVYSPP